MAQYSNIFFICDPEKHADNCKRSYCRALNRGMCYLTTHQEYAKVDKDGNPKRSVAEPAEMR